MRGTGMPHRLCGLDLGCLGCVRHNVRWRGKVTLSHGDCRCEHRGCCMPSTERVVTLPHAHVPDRLPNVRLERMGCVLATLRRRHQVEEPFGDHTS